MTREQTVQDRLYEEAAGEFGAAVGRLARVYEADPEVRRDLLQDLHVALWQSFRSYDARCSLRTWVYRVAHNVAAMHVMRQRRHRGFVFLGLDDLERLLDLPAHRGLSAPGERYQEFWPTTRPLTTHTAPAMVLSFEP